MENLKTMTDAQINSEIEKTKLLMDKLKACVEEGKMEYYNDYLSTSTYYLKLNQVKPKHNLKVV